MRSFSRDSLIIRFLLALSGGVLAALAFPNAGIELFAFGALAPLLVALTAARGKSEAFLLGQVAMTVAWLINVPWVVNVMAVYGGLGYATGILIFFAMALILGAYGGLFSLFVYLVHPGRHFRSWLVIPFIWAASEYARTYLLSGFPWNLLGTSIADLRGLAMLSTWFGPYAVGALLALCSAAIAWSVTTSEPVRKRATVVACCAVLVVASWGCGALEVRKRDAARIQEKGTLTAAMLQPNISQEMRWDNENLLLIFDRMTRMTEEAAARGATVVVWPESTVPLAFATTDFFREFVESITRDRQVDVILGSVAHDPDNEMKLWNSAYLIHNGATTGRYDKIRLVPFGEYVPLRKMLFFAEKLVRAVGTFQFGSNDRPLEGSLRYGPAICYEIVYPRIPAAQTSHGAEVLVTITNDAWFGRSAAPEQHLLSARMRAIEADRYLLRSATTGISAIIDPTGRVVERLPLEQQGMIVGKFAPRHSITPYVRFGDWFAIVATALTLAVALIRRKVRLLHG